MERKWWHGKTAYQIYPKSFCDSNGDGIGDLRGIISRLDYLQQLGVDIVWLSPIYCSPLADQGYDISDYYHIDPRFGTMEDMDELLAQAKKRGIAIVMDLVVNHCSDEHEWFKKACEDPEGRYGQYFYICDHREGEPLPCNWRSYFGGPCWDRLPGHEDKIYLHVFHKKQPDLNWENSEVREEVYKMINWWLDKGVAGFRVDAIINIKKKLPFSSYPADRADGLCCIDRMLEEAVGVGDYLDEMAEKTFRRYDAFSVGEVFNEKEEELPLFIGDNGYFSTIFDFSENSIGKDKRGWYACGGVSAEEYKAAVFKTQRKVEGVGLLSNIIENHDEPRGVSHYIPAEDCCERSKKLLGGLCFLLKGLPFLYQGQEIGMENFTYESIEEADDISALDQYQVALDAGLSPAEALKAVDHFSRDNARSPFQWDGSTNAGFTTGKPWLRVNPNYPSINLAEQMGREDSLWHFYRRLIDLRRSKKYQETLVYAPVEPYREEQTNLMAYYRRGERTLLVLGNFQRERQCVPLSGEVKVLLNNTEEFVLENGILTMEGYQLVVVEIL